MAIVTHLRSIADHNLKTIRNDPLSELSGALGDLGTLLPLMIAMALQGSINLGSTLVFSGLANIITGAVYGIPLPVQPMKAIASVAISQGFSKDETAAAGLTVAFAVLFLSITGLLRWLNAVVPVPVVKGIQVGAGLNLVTSAGTSLIKPLGWTDHVLDNKTWAMGAFSLLVVSSLGKKIPYALIILIVGLPAMITAQVRGDDPSPLLFWHPRFHIPSLPAWSKGALDAALPQLPLTTLNSILAVVSLSATLFPEGPPTPSTTSIGLSVATWNIVGCWFSAMPICHGSGGLAGQYRFGARSGASIIVLGSVKLLLGFFAGDAVLPMLRGFPHSLLGIMVLAAGVELAKVGQTVAEKSDQSDIWTRAHAEATANEHGRADTLQKEIEQVRKDRWMVMLVTVAGCLAFKNDAVGFLAGMTWHFSLSIPSAWDKVKSRFTGEGQIRLNNDSTVTA